MNYVGSPLLSAAVANAGGLGLLTAHRQQSATELRDEIRATSKLLDPGCQGALGVNLTLLPELIAEVPYDEFMTVIVEEGVSVVETSGLLPSDYITELKRNDVKVIHKCVKISDAQIAQQIGADVISLDGFECNGQPAQGEIGNWVLQAIGARELSVPYITSGGVADGRQLAAALALGASGVNMGTRFMASQEAAIDPGIKQAIVDRGAGSTGLATRQDGMPPDHRPHGVRLSVWSCGSVMGLIDDVPTCAELIEWMVTQAVGVIEEPPKNVQL